MNKRFLISIFTLSLMIIGLASCVNDNVTGGKPLPKGTEFDFGTTVDANLSRTYYDPADVANPNATYWKIFWNYQDPLDQVYIYSPQAMTGRQQAAYTVNGVKDQYSATATKNSEIGIQLSDANTYNFYGMYPAQNVKANSGSGCSLSATMPIFQTASTTEIMNSETNVGNLETTADMNSALMIANEAGFMPNTQNNAKVNLQFEPFASMLNVTVNGVEQSNFNYKVLITSIIIEADAPIAGDFTYNYETKAITFGENPSNFIRIDTRFKDAAGHQIGVPMGPDSKLNVRAFMIPNPNVKSLKVKVVTSAAQTLTKTLNMTNFKENNSLIYFAKLPKINASNLQFDYKIWLSQLDPNIYLSEISMPGSALTFSYKLNKDYQKTQTLNLKEQFENGIRVFQFHVTNDGQKVAVALPVTGTPMPKDGGGTWTINDVIDALHAEMTGLHKDEFCVVAISDWLQDGNKGLSDMIQLYQRLKVEIDEAGKRGLVATNVTPNTTIADVKGKVIFKIQLNGSESKYFNAWKELNGTDAWMNIFDDVANTSVYYSQMPFKTVPATSASGTSANVLSNNGMNFIYSEVANPVTTKYVYIPPSYNAVYRNGVKDCATAVLAAYAKNYNSDEHKNFSMTYLGGQGIEYKNDGTKYYLPSQIAKDLNTIWLDYIKANTQNTTEGLRIKPWGWVMLNRVGTEPTTSWCIEAVIRHNADPVFKHQRRSEKVRHSGDTQGTTNGGSIF